MHFHDFHEGRRGMCTKACVHNFPEVIFMCVCVCFVPGFCIETEGRSTVTVSSHTFLHFILFV